MTHIWQGLRSGQWLTAARARTVVDVETSAPQEVKSTPPHAPQAAAR